MVAGLKPAYLIAGAAVAAALLYQRGAARIGQDIGGAAVDLVTGVVVGAGEAAAEVAAAGGKAVAGAARDTVLNPFYAAGKIRGGVSDALDSVSGAAAQFGGDVATWLRGY